ncbi:MAG: SEC-C metal-binding domain-containing protein, partial [Patescibacteria group bacterium]|nr:SEC-C metal-binding domain-containing protein [Patescibacteria group bacterium]
KMRVATLSDSGIEKMEKWLGIDNIYTEKGVREVHHIEQALKAHALFKANKDYVVKEGEVIIVDEFTGRLMQGRRYSEGLHQAIEAKENVKIQRESQTLATITFQNYFRMYNKLSGMTGTAVTEAEEFSKIYNLETLTIPTHQPIQRIDKNDFIYSSEESKYKAVVVEAKKRSEKGQPILIGTISIEKNEILSNLMERSGLKPNVLNAKNHKKEADYIADAGKRGTITIATNMAGRGVDIVLGGTSPEEDSAEYAQWKKDHEEIKSLGGLHVIGTERHESRRIDNQLRGRAGRQGDQGSSQFFVSMEDDLMRIFGGDRMKSIMATLKVPEDMPIENKLISRSIESAQTKVEGNNFDIRKHLVEYDDVINKHREAIYQKRKEVLNMADKIKNDNSSDELSKIIIKHINSEIEQVVSFHTAAEDVISWNLAEIYQTMSTIFPVESELESDLSEFTKGDNNKLNKAEARTAIIEHLEKMAKENYDKISEKAREAGVNWSELEKSILIRSIDTLWIEHLEAMSSVRQGIGLRGYGQRDPLIEYKKEAYRLYNELNGFIQKEVVYSIYKVGSIKTTEAQKFSAPSLLNRAINFSAPAKVMDNTSESLKISLKLKDNKGNKVGRNDPCPCGSGKKYKKCHGK